MTMKSKFQSRCKACSCTINVGDDIEWTREEGARHATLAQCHAAKLARAAQPAAAPVVTLSLKPIAEFLRAAEQRGLKSPKLRVLAIDGRQELRLGLTRTGVAPGSISVVLAGDFVGCIRPDDAVTSKLKSDVPLQKHLLTVAEDPVTAAKKYAALMGLCSFCGLPLTDAGSVEVGYGPVCAKHWGLPHKPKGTPVLHAVGGGQEPLPLRREDPALPIMRMVDRMVHGTKRKVIILDQFLAWPTPYALQQSPMRFEDLVRLVDGVPEQFKSPLYGYAAKITEVDEAFVPEMCTTVWAEDANGNAFAWKYRWDSSG